FEVSPKLPLRNLVVIIPPFLTLQVNKSTLEVRAQHTVHQRVVVEHLNCLEESSWQRLHTKGRQRVAMKEIHILPNRITGVPIVLNAFEASVQVRRCCEVRIARSIHNTTLDSSAS